MFMERGAGILMHIASLPGKFGIGTFGKEAYKFADFLNQSGIISSNLDLNFETNSYRATAIPVINNITTMPSEDLEDYSVIIYVVKTGDTLWKIAKRFGSTVDDIVRVNGIERPDKLNIGEKIYIPKYVLKRAKEPITLAVNV